jgi:DNA-3-methyladenine glycosylase II
MSPSRPSVRKAEAELAARDPVFADLIARHGHCTLGRRRSPASALDYFSALVESIVYQQLAGAAAASIHRSFLARFEGEPTPEAVLALPPEQLRAAGLSGSKAAAIVGVAQAVVSGELALDNLRSKSDDEVVTMLSSLRGIGPWTANMFCIFTLQRLDVWPVSDYGIRKGYARAFGLAELPTPRALTPLGDPYRPWRSVAAWYLWRVAEE